MILIWLLTESKLEDGNEAVKKEPHMNWKNVKSATLVFLMVIRSTTLFSSKSPDIIQ